MTTRGLEIRLTDQRVGCLTEAAGTFRLRFYQSWREHPERRVFSLACEASGNKDIGGAPRLPTWFENLRFEGDLRRWIFESEDRLPKDEFSLLARIGGDLLGAATLHEVETVRADDPPADVEEPSPRPPSGRVHWSLAGVQLKLNLAARGDRFTLPVHGELGHFIAKFADRRAAGVPANEHTTMRWAEAAGIEVAETRLIEVSEIDELPESMRIGDEPALLVRRFDRHDGRRIHAEEFAQALDVRPTDKYTRLGWRHHLRLINRVSPDDVAEYLRRLLFVIASGNSDAHHKNWAFIYPDGRTPRLAPAYDLVSVVTLVGLHHDFSERLAYPLSKARRWEEVRLESVVRLLAEVGVDAFVDCGSVVERGQYPTWIRDQVQRIRDTVPRTSVPVGYAEGIEQHWARTPLLRG